MVNPTAPHIRPWADNKTLTVINFFGGPGTGKSTTAAELFAAMKKRGMRVELIHEVAKEYVWERWDHIFREQDYISAHQHRQQRRLVGHDIDYVILDSSILLGLFYTPDDFPPSFKVFLRDVFDSYDNLNIYLTRSSDFPYQQEGRNQDEETAREIDEQVLAYLEDTDTPFHDILAGDGAVDDVLEIVVRHHEDKTALDFE